MRETLTEALNRLAEMVAKHIPEDYALDAPETWDIGPNVNPRDPHMTIFVPLRRKPAAAPAVTHLVVESDGPLCGSACDVHRGHSCRLEHGHLDSSHRCCWSDHSFSRKEAPAPQPEAREQEELDNAIADAFAAQTTVHSRYKARLVSAPAPVEAGETPQEKRCGKCQVPEREHWHWSVSHEFVAPRPAPAMPDAVAVMLPRETAEWFVERVNHYQSPQGAALQAEDRDPKNTPLNSHP